MTPEQLRRATALEGAAMQARKLLHLVHGLPTTGLHGPALEQALGDAAWAFFATCCLFHEYAVLNGHGDEATKKLASDLLSEAEFQLDELGICPVEQVEPAPPMTTQYLN